MFGHALNPKMRNRYLNSAPIAFFVHSLYHHATARGVSALSSIVVCKYLVWKYS